MDSVPVWVLLIALGSLGALIMFMIGIVSRHIDRDTKVHERVAVMESKIVKIEDEIHRPDGILERLHKHGGKLQNLVTRMFIKDNQQ